MFKRRNKKDEMKPAKKESVFAAIDRVFWLLFRLVGPMAAAAILTPHFSVLFLLLVGLLCWLSAAIGMKKIAKSISWSMTGIVLGSAVSFFYWLPFWLGVPLGIGMLLGGLAGLASFERKLGIAEAPEALPPTQNEDVSAWHDHAVLTPEGEPLRSLAWGELGMGGPVVGSYLFPDGVVLGGLGSSVRFSPSGRYFASPMPGRQSWGLLIFDRDTRTVYRHMDLSAFWEIDAFTDEEIIGRHSPLIDNQTHRIALQELLKPELAVVLEPVYDLWLEPGWESEAAPSVRTCPAPQGAHVLTAQRYIPGSLRALDDPFQPLYYPAYRVQIDGQDSDLLIDEDEPVIWRADGKAVVCRGRSLTSQQRWPQDYWLWQAGEGWQVLPELLSTSRDEPVVNWGEAVELNADALIISGQFDYPQVDGWECGYYLQHTMSDFEVAGGHDVQGRLQLTQATCSRVQLCLSLNDQPDLQRVRSAALQTGERALFTWQRSSHNERLAAYTCSIGDWDLPGLWLLDHRVSECGRYIALVAFADVPAVPDQVLLADVQQRTLLALQHSVLYTRLVDLRGGELSLLRVLGRLNEREQSSPLCRFDQPVPRADQADSFIMSESDARLYYELLTLKIEDDRLRPVPRWRLVIQPQVANAAGDFVLPAPGKGDAAWLFGAETEYRDNYPREQFPRGGGYVLTASGIGMDDVSPSMIWSDDGRYLALTRYIRRMACNELVDTDQWQLILIDTQQHTWRLSVEHVGCMPLFIGFDAQAINVRIFEYDSEVEGDAGVVRTLALGDLLNLKAEAMHPIGPLWLPKHEAGRNGQWLALDQSHLQGLCRHTARLEPTS